MTKERKSYLGNVMFAVVGIALIVGGAIWLVSITNFRETAVKTEAVITSITTYEDSDGETEYNAIAEYTADGVSYSGSVSYRSGLKEGDTVRIYYNPDDPQRFQDSGDPIVAVIMIIMGVLCSFVGFFPVIYKLLPDNKNRRV